MKTLPKQARVTAEAFLAWAEAQPRGRFELAGGEIVAMAPERAGHTRAKLEAVVALRAAIGRRSLDCEALTDGMSVRIDDETVFEPDALVRCGPRTPDDAVEISDPVIVVEVVSPSSRGIDSGVKLVGYFRLPSVRHYLVIHTETRLIAHHRRDDAEAISVQVRHDGALVLDPPGLVIEIEEIFGAP